MFHHYNHNHHRHCGQRGGRGPFGFGAAFGEGRPGGGRRGRMFDGGELRLVLLRLIADEPRHGYDLIREIETITGGAYAPSPGVVYPTLTLLDEMGLIAEQQSDGAKKRFAITDTGNAHLTEQAELADALMARLRSLGEHRERTDGAAPIRRSMGNLKVALADRLGRGDFSEDTLHDVAALIDEVAQKIERLR
ncbi:PadR family transcriptional regulator [Sphingomonas sp. KR1UV-12]|uniref:PadR family transcriptional regulator n=1 Tax=Sphingomonas aurea TaxID=3063994 RepID=A0ABT9EIC4_9SPHN|nr:PadR family transcriptional regulator [Sphingomonas sp. KR1UV-12]MDP1026521.1 PadR family transcriptional regulator [Sphingomonas sp. KR1UV-12]